MLVHNIKGTRWWYGSRDWTTPLVLLHFVAALTAAEGHFDTEVQMNQRCVTEFLHMEKSAPIDIYQHLMNIYVDQAVDVSTAR